jgi:hypothetical protein
MILGLSSFPLFWPNSCLPLKHGELLSHCSQALLSPRQRTLACAQHRSRFTERLPEDIRLTFSDSNGDLLHRFLHDFIE